MESFVRLVTVSSTPLEMAPLPKSHVSLRHRNHLFFPMSIGSFVDQVISRLQQSVPVLMVLQCMQTGPLFLIQKRITTDNCLCKR